MVWAHSGIYVLSGGDAKLSHGPRTYVVLWSAEIAIHGLISGVSDGALLVTTLVHLLIGCHVQ